MKAHFKIPLTWGQDEQRRMISDLRRKMLQLRFVNVCVGGAAILREPDQAVELGVLSPYRGVGPLFGVFVLLSSLIFVDQASVDS
jgi:hypothetical protein